MPAECVSRRITVTSWNAAVSNSLRYRPSGAFRSTLPISQSRRTAGAVAITFVRDAMSKMVSAVISSGCGTVRAPAQRPSGGGSDRPDRRPARAPGISDDATESRTASSTAELPGDRLGRDRGRRGRDHQHGQDQRGENEHRPSETAWPYDTGSRARRRAKIAAPGPVLRFARGAARVRDRRHRLRRQGGHPRTSCAGFSRPLPRPAGLRAATSRASSPSTACPATSCSPTGSPRAWRAAPPSCIWSASSASSAGAASPSSACTSRPPGTCSRSRARPASSASCR